MADMPQATPNLDGLPVLLSAGVPQSLAAGPRAQQVYTALAALVRSLLAAGAHLVFGGHPTVTPLVHRAATRVGGGGGITLYQLQRFRDQAPAEVDDAAIFTDVRWMGDGQGDMDQALGAMRDAMAAQARAAVFVGGKTQGFAGSLPGKRDELQRFRACHPQGPVYLIGMLGGETPRLVDGAEAGSLAEHNGLSPQAARLVHRADDIAVIAPLIAGDLAGLTRAGST
jgi:hypothetical protein